MNKYTYNLLEFPQDLPRELWKSYWVKPGLYHYQLRLPVHYAWNLEDWNDGHHIHLDDVLLTYGLAKLPVLNAWFQLETSPNEYNHWQAHVVTSKPIDTTTVRAAIFPEASYRINIYCRVARDPWDSVSYCTKERTRVQGPWFYTASRQQPRSPQAKCTTCNDSGCLDCSAMTLNALEKPL